MVTLSNKVFAAIFAFVIIIAVLCVLLAMNFMGWGTALSGVGGPFAAGFYKILLAPFLWVVNGGWPTLLTGIVVIAALMLSTAYLTWHYDVPLKFTGATSASPASGYDNSMKREPEEPERSQSSITK